MMGLSEDYGYFCYVWESWSGLRLIVLFSIGEMFFCGTRCIMGCFLGLLSEETMGGKSEVNR